MITKKYIIIKRKEFIDAEYKVVDIDIGNGNRSGTAKHLVCYCPKTKTTFNSNIKGSFEYLKEIYDNRKDYIGQLATIKYFQLTPDGIPRFPYAIGISETMSKHIKNIYTTYNSTYTQHIVEHTKSISNIKHYFLLFL